MATAAPASFDSLYPFFIEGHAAAMQGIHATLFEHSPEEPDVSYPYVAQDIEASKDHSKVIFTIRKNAYFHDETRITADDVVFSFKFLTTKCSPFYASYYSSVEKAEAISSDKVVFYLKKDSPKETPLILCQLPVLSEKFFTTHDVKKNPLIIPVGSGPYRVHKVVPGKLIILKRMKDWWGENLPSQVGRHNFDYERHEYFMDPISMFEGFKVNEYDFHTETIAKNWVNSYDFPAVLDGRIIKKTFKTMSPNPGYAICFNTRKELLKNKEIRKCLAMALLDFPWINKKLFFNSYRRLTSFFDNTRFMAIDIPSKDEVTAIKTIRNEFQDFHKYFDKEILLKDAVDFTTFGDCHISKRIAMARSMLKKHGWVIKKGIAYHKEHGKFELELIIPGEKLEKIAIHMKNNLAKIGVVLSIKVTDITAYMQKRNSFEYDMIIDFMTQSDTPGCELVERITSESADMKGGGNLSGIKNPLIDVIIDKILKSKTLDEITSYAKLLDRTVLSNYYCVLLWAPYGINAAYWDKFEFPSEPPRSGIDPSFWWIRKERKKLRTTK